MQVWGRSCSNGALGLLQHATTHCSTLQHIAYLCEVECTAASRDWGRCTPACWSCVLYDSFMCVAWHDWSNTNTHTNAHSLAYTHSFSHNQGTHVRYFWQIRRCKKSNWLVLLVAVSVLRCVCCSVYFAVCVMPCAKHTSATQSDWHYNIHTATHTLQHTLRNTHTAARETYQCKRSTWLVLSSHHQLEMHPPTTYMYIDIYVYIYMYTYE